MTIATERNYARLIREMRYREARALACEDEREITIDEHARELGVSKSTLNRAIAWDKGREKHKHLVDADQQEAVLSALDKRHNILMRDMARLSKAEYHGAGNELTAVNNALLKIEQAQADVLDQRRFNLGETMLTPEGQLFREGEGFTLERWEEITPDIPISEKHKRILLNRMRVDFLAGLIASAPELADRLTESKRKELKDYIKEHLPGDQGKAVKVA